MESALYGIYALAVFVHSLVRFLIQKQLVRKYPTRALYMKQSIYLYVCFVW